MGVMDRFFGGRDKSEKLGEQLIANPACEQKLSLQVLFPVPVALESENLKGWLRAYDAELANATCEIDPETNAQGTPLGLAGWRNHVIQIVGFNGPWPSEAVEKCLSAVHCTPEMKETARGHQANVVLYYAGYEESVLEQYVAMAAVAGALAGLGATMVLNEAGLTSLPAGVLNSDEVKGKRMDILRVLPPHYLYCGCVQYWVEGTPGAWLRTCGHHLLGVPDFAILTPNEEVAAMVELFADLLGYALDSRAHFEAGQTMQMGDLFVRLRVPTQDEYFLDNPGPIFVAEPVGG
jgi:hypothetical protein